jgi:hypothetical protein
MTPVPEIRAQTLDREFFADARRKAWARKSEAEKKAAASKACVWRITDFPRISNSPHTGELVARAEGDSFVIRGQKSAWVSNGTFATHAALYVSLESARSMGMAGRMRVRPHGDGTR